MPDAGLSAGMGSEPTETMCVMRPRVMKYTGCVRGVKEYPSSDDLLPVVLGGRGKGSSA